MSKLFKLVFIGFHFLDSLTTPQGSAQGICEGIPLGPLGRGGGI